MNPPRVSILLPTYNYGRYLPEAIGSILAQNFTDFELIISDDNSTDDSSDVINHFAAHDCRIQHYRHSCNLGMVANWNWTLNKARGEYVKYLFGDDCLASPDTLSRLVALLDTNPTASVAASARLTIDGSSQITGIWNELKQEGVFNGREIIQKCLFHSANLVGEPSVTIFRRELALQGFDRELKQIVDLEMWFRLLLNHDLVYTAQPLCCFRIHGAQQTAINRESQIGHTEMVRTLRKFLPQLRAQPVSRLTTKRIIFRTLFLLQKKKQRDAELNAELNWLKTQMSTGWWLACWAMYRVSRPMENIKHSLRKRLYNQRLPENASNEMLFLSRVRASYPRGNINAS